jgi:DNA-binding NarL/FixJ family response regulator
MIMFENKELSDREKEIIKLVIQGYKNKEIADIVKICHRTVTTHLTNVYHKLDINNRSRLVYLVLNDIIDIS